MAHPFQHLSDPRDHRGSGREGQVNFVVNFGLYALSCPLQEAMYKTLIGNFPSSLQQLCIYQVLSMSISFLFQG